jgi:hypothetical protein
MYELVFRHRPVPVAVALFHDNVFVFPELTADEELGVWNVSFEGLLCYFLNALGVAEASGEEHIADCNRVVGSLDSAHVAACLVVVKPVQVVAPIATCEVGRVVVG